MVPWGRDRHEPRRTRADTHASDHFRHTSSAQCPSSDGAVALTGRRHGGRARGRPVELRLLAAAGWWRTGRRLTRRSSRFTPTPKYRLDAPTTLPPHRVGVLSLLAPSRRT